MNFEGKNILVTGGSGFIGSHLTENLASSGAEVTVIDTNFNSNLDGIDGIEKIICDISGFDDLKKNYRDIDYIFHLAALAYPQACEKDPHAAFRANVLGTFNVLHFASQIEGIRKVVFPSSAQLYGKNPEYLPIDESHPTEQADIYSETKYLGENLCKFFMARHELPVVFFRLFNSFGPKQAAGYFMPTVIMQALRNGVVELWSDKPTRDFTYVKDTVDAFLKAAQVKFCGGPVNIGSGREIPVKDIAMEIASGLDAEIKFLNKEVGGSLRMCGDIKLAKRVLGWEPRTSLKDGIRTTIEWYKENLHNFQNA